MASLQYHMPSPLEYFASLVLEDDGIPLTEAAISLAQDVYEDVDIQAVQYQIDRWADTIKRRLPADAPVLHRLRMLNQFFFQELGMSGNANNYYDPDNSFLHRVVETRRGIPISLAVIWLDLARAIKLDAQGVSFPGHFMVTVYLPVGQVVMDPLSGNSFNAEELNEMLEPWRKRMGLPEPEEPSLGLHLRPATARDMLVRMLRNLKEIYRSNSGWGKALAVQQRLLILQPQAWEEYRDRGEVYAALGQALQAKADWERYLHEMPDAPDRVLVLAHLMDLPDVGDAGDAAPSDPAA